MRRVLWSKDCARRFGSVNLVFASSSRKYCSSIGGQKKAAQGRCNVGKFREGAGGGDLKDRSISHAVKSAIGSQGESRAGVLPLARTAEAVERFEGARRRYAEHRPEVVGATKGGSPVILSARPQRKRCLWARTVRTSEGVEHGEYPRLRVQAEYFAVS